VLPCPLYSDAGGYALGRIHVVVGGQFGSEGKGHVTAWLARMLNPGAVVRVAGPNAGHTAYDDAGRAFALRQIPAAAVACDASLVIAAGSEIDPLVLASEIDMLEEAGIPIRPRLVIDGMATVIQPHHQQAEEELSGRIGSTGKGIGAARSDRIMRRALTWDTWRQEEGEDWAKEFGPVRTDWFLENRLRSSDVIIEGTQGYGLGLHAGYYPYCTSSDCRAIDFLAMAGLTPNSNMTVWPVYRTFPIRVAGSSGPLRQERTWEDLAEATGGYIRPERTTVTQKTRRVGMWDPALAEISLRANGGPAMCRPVLLFLDYWYPDLAGKAKLEDLTAQAIQSIEKVEFDLDCRVSAVGTGPDTIIPLA